MLDLLRETLGSLKVTPLYSRNLPMRAMTEWMRDPVEARPTDMQLGDKAVLKVKGDDGMLRASQVGLDGDDIHQLLEGGRQVSQLAVVLEGRMAFVLHDDLAIKSIKFDDALIDEASQTEDEGDALVCLEIDFLLMALALGASIDRVLEWLGGETDASITLAVQEQEAS